MENLNLQTIAGYCTSISAIVALVVLVVKPLRNKFVSWISKTSDRDGINELDKQSKALQCSLRNSILVIFNSRMKLGYMTIYEKQNIAKLYSEYQNLGGNSFVSEIVEELNNLPVKNE